MLSDLPSTCFFATFKSQQAAAIASQTNLNPIMQRLFNVQPAPRPDDVNWSALQRSWWQRTVGGVVWGRSCGWVYHLHVCVSDGRLL